MSVWMPSELASRLARLPPYNRTTHVNNAVRTYLEIQGPAKNRYGVDCDYFKGKMAVIMRDMGDFTPEELNGALRQLARTAIGFGDEREAINESI